MAYTNIRLGSVVSADFDIRMTNRFAQMIKDGQTITVDQGKTMISFIHLEDVAEALAVLMENILAGKEAAPLYNLANNEWMTVPELVDLANEVAAENGYTPATVLTSDKESFYNNVCNSDLFYEQQQWQPKHQLRDLLEELF